MAFQPDEKDELLMDIQPASTQSIENETDVNKLKEWIRTIGIPTQQSLSNLRQKLKTMQERETSMMQEFTKNNDTQSNNISTLKEFNEISQQLIRTKTLEFNEINNELLQVTKDKNALQEKYSNLVNEQTVQKHNKEKIVSLEKALDSYYTKESDWKTQKETFENEIKKLKQENKELTTNNESFVETHATFEKRLSATKLQIDDYSEMKNKYSASAAENATQIQDLKNTIAQKDGEIENLRQQLSFQNNPGHELSYHNAASNMEKTLKFSAVEQNAHEFDLFYPKSDTIRSVSKFDSKAYQFHDTYTTQPSLPPLSALRHGSGSGTMGIQNYDVKLANLDFENDKLQMENDRLKMQLEDLKRILKQERVTNQVEVNKIKREYEKNDNGHNVSTEQELIVNGMEENERTPLLEAQSSRSDSNDNGCVCCSVRIW